VLALAAVCAVLILTAVPARAADRPFDWDHYHDRQDACRELQAAQLACATYGLDRHGSKLWTRGMNMRSSVEDLKPLTSLRFFAALAIVLLHAKLYTKWGWLQPIQIPLGQGVSFFFVLSGFISPKR
jgi:hypothetical protein